MYDYKLQKVNPEQASQACSPVLQFTGVMSASSGLPQLLTGTNLQCWLLLQPGIISFTTTATLLISRPFLRRLPLPPQLLLRPPGLHLHMRQRLKPRNTCVLGLPPCSATNLH